MITLTSSRGNLIPDTKPYTYEKVAARNARKLVDANVRKSVHLKDEEGTTLQVIK